MNRHHLRREIIATQLSNAIITDMGPAFVYQMVDESGEAIAKVMRAYVITRAIFAVDTLWAEINSLDFKVNVATQIEMIAQVVRLLRRGTRWYLRNWRNHVDIKIIVADFAQLKKEVYTNILDLLVGADRQTYDTKLRYLTKQAVPAEIASKIASLPAMYAILNIIDAAKQYGDTCKVQEVAKIHFELAERLGLTWLREQVNLHPIDSHWTVLARAIFKADLDWQQRGFIASVLAVRDKSAELSTAVDKWHDQYKDVLDRWQQMLAELHSQTKVTMDMLTVAIRELHDVTEVCIVNIKDAAFLASGMKKPLVLTH